MRLGAATLLTTPLAYAAGKNVFHVEGVTVDARAQDELTAKALGLASAKQQAVQLLLARLSPRHDQDRLPEADAKTMNELVRDFSLANERFGGGRYLASLIVRFNPAAVRDLLRDHQISFAETHKEYPVWVLVCAATNDGEAIYAYPAASVSELSRIGLKHPPSLKITPPDWLPLFNLICP